MLTLMRSLLRTKAAGLLFVLLIVAMAAWGVTDVFGGGLGNNLAGAGDRTLSEREFDAEVERILRNQTDDRGRAITKEQALDNGMIDEIFQRERLDLALRAYGDTVGVTATTQAVQDDLITTPAFLDTTGVFDPVLYKAILENNGMRPADYQDGIEGELTISRLQRLPVAALKVPKALARIEAGFNAEQRSASWFAISQADLPEIGEPTDEQLQALYTELEAALREPERRQISLLRVSPDDFVSQAEITDEDIDAFYNAYQAQRYTAEGERVFTEFNFADEALARAAPGRIAGGANAAALEGLDSSQRKTGKRDLISLDFLAGQVFGSQAQLGGIYGPVQNGSVWTIIRLEEIIPGDITPLDVVRDEIQNELATQHALGIFYDALPRFDDLIGTGASLVDIGLELGAPVLTFEAVDRTGRTENGGSFRTLLEAPGLIQMAFDRPEGGKTERIGDDEVTWMAEVDAIVPESLPPFEEVKDELTEAWNVREQSEQLRNATSAAEARLNSGEVTIAELAAENNSVVQSLPAPLTRVNFRANLPNDLIRGLFSAREEGAVLSSPGLPNEMIVLQVNTIERAAPETLDLMAGAVAPQLQTEVSNDLFQAFFVEIQKSTELEMNAAGLETYKRRIAPEL